MKRPVKKSNLKKYRYNLEIEQEAADKAAEDELFKSIEERFEDSDD